MSDDPTPEHVGIMEVSKEKQPREWKGGTPTEALGVTVLSFVANAWMAFVLWKFYGWFVLPLGAPMLSWAHLWGLSTLLDLIVIGVVPMPESKGFKHAVESLIGKSIIFGILLPLGWVLSWFVT